MTNQPQRNAGDQQPGGLERLYRIDEITKIGSLSRAKLYDDIKLGRLKILKFGRSTRVSESAWRNYLELAASPAVTE
jgi:hypothetical protein